MAYGAGDLVNITTGNVNAYTGVANTTTDLSVGMKTYWDTEMLENMRPKMVYVQFGRKHPLPRNRGKIIEWRKWGKLGNITRLVEGVIKTGLKLTETSVYASVAQYGDYITISEQLDLKHVDPVIMGAEEELSAAAANTMDILTRDGVMAEATNWVMADTCTVDANGNWSSTGAGPTAPYLLAWGAAARNPLTPDMVAQIVTMLRANDVQSVDGKFVAIAHPLAIYDLMRSDDWIDYHKYEATQNIFNGEVGELYGVRFVETTNAPVMAGGPLVSDAKRYMTISAYDKLVSAGTISAGNGYGVGSLYRFTVSDDLSASTTTADLEGLVGQYILFEDGGTLQDRLLVTGVDVTSDYVYVSTEPTTTPASTDKLLPGNGGLETSTANKQVALFATMFLGRDAYGVIDPAEGNVHMIIKSKQQIGGPLEQFSTVGVKFETGTKILYQDRVMVLYSTGKFSDKAKANWSM